MGMKIFLTGLLFLIFMGTIVRLFVPFDVGDTASIIFAIITSLSVITALVGLVMWIWEE